MKALSVKEPWATLIIHFGKNTENRSWPTAYRGPLLIHASKGVDLDRDVTAIGNCFQDSWKDLREYVIQKSPDMRPPLDLPVQIPAINPGYAIGIVDVIGCDQAMRSPWDERGQYHWRLRNPRPIEAFMMRGQLGLYDVTMPATEQGKEMGKYERR